MTFQPFDPNSQPRPLPGQFQPQPPQLQGQFLPNNAPRQQFQGVGDGVEAFGAGIRKWRAIAVGATAAKAGQNAYAETGDPVHAAQVGAVAFFRWMWWVSLMGWALFLLFFAVGFTTTSSSGHSNGSGYSVATILTAIMVWPFAFGVTWCRNIDFCLFKRGMWYRLFAPVARHCDGVGMVFLHALLLVPMFFCWKMFVTPWGG